MIEAVTIADIATYGSTPEVLSGFSQFNFLFGSNGVGKTTVSRVLAEEGKYPSCTVTWKGGTKLQPMVYNRDFIERNFNQATDLKGVFTLGEKQVDTLNKIATAKAEFDALTKKLETVTLGLQGEDGTGGKKGELATIEGGCKDKCWAQKQKHDAKLQGAFEGYRNNSEKFKEKVLKELASNVSTLEPLADLEKRAETLYGPPPAAEQPVSVVATAKLLDHESNPILAKRVIGKDDVDIAAMIKKLGNSDWVREGRTFYEVNDGVCPFCQQNTTESFSQSLAEYFDEAFVADSKAIDDLVTGYSTDSARVQQQIASIIATPSKFIDLEKLKREKELLDSKITINIQRLAGKKKEASRVVELDSLKNVADAIKALIDSANVRVVEHNRMVANLSKERSTLTAQIWRFVLEEIRTDLDSYKLARNSTDKAIDSMNGVITATTRERTKKANEIRELEKQTTSVQPSRRSNV